MASPTSTQEPLPPASARVMVVGRRGCHLCDDAVAVVAQVCGRTGDTWQVVLTEDHPELADAYAYEVPVVFVDQRRHAFWHVDPARLAVALAGPASGA